MPPPHGSAHHRAADRADVVGHHKGEVLALHDCRRLWGRPRGTIDQAEIELISGRLCLGRHLHGDGTASTMACIMRRWPGAAMSATAPATQADRRRIAEASASAPPDGNFLARRSQAI